VDYNLYQAEDFAADEFFIAYYLKTDINAIRFWENWISLHPEKLDEIFNAEELIALMHLRLPAEEFHLEALKFDQFIRGDEQKENGQNKSFSLKYSLMLASIGIAFILSVFFLLSFPKKEQLTYITKHSPFGKTIIFHLSDGSTITLNANSTIKMPKVFGTKARKVFLSGEAFFEVAKDVSRPFTVVANGTQTTVLGTKFNVSAYSTKKHVKVALLEGSVELSANAGRDRMILKPTEMATYSKTKKSLNRTSFNAYETTAWRDGAIVFHNATFGEIADQLKNLYGITLIDQSGKKNWNYTGQFNHTDYISILKNICFAEHLNFTQTNQTIKLKPKK